MVVYCTTNQRAFWRETTDAPNPVVEITSHPLSNDIASLVRLNERLIVVHIRNIHQRLLVDYSNRSVHHKVEGYTTQPTLQSSMIVPQTQPRIWFHEYLDDQVSIPMLAFDSFEKPCRAKARSSEFNKGTLLEVPISPPFVYDIRPEVSHKRV